MNILNDIELTIQEENKVAQNRKAKEISDYDVFIKILHSFYQKLLPLNLGTVVIERQGWGDCEGAGDIYYTNCVLHVVLQHKKDGFFWCSDAIHIEYRSGWEFFGPTKTISIYQSLIEKDKLDCYNLVCKPEETWAFEPDEIYQLIIKELIRDKFKSCEKNA